MTKIIPKKKPDDSLPLTPNNLYFTFQQFLVTWINIITKERSIYPEESYEFRNSFNLQCPYNRHPDVTKWNDDLISDIMDDLCFVCGLVRIKKDHTNFVLEKNQIDIVNHI